MTGGYRRGGWDEWLERLEEEAGGTPAAALLERIADRVLDKARLVRGDSVVDLGAGHGLLALKAAPIVGPGGKVVAVDSEPGCLRRLRRDCDKRGIGNVFPTLGRLEKLPLESGEYNAAVCRSALIYTGDLDAAASEMNRVLASGGRLSVFEPLPGEMAWSVPEGDSYRGFLRLERIISEEREPRPLDRERLRRAFEAEFSGVESLVVHYRVTFKGMSPEDIAGEYLHDLPGEMAALPILRLRVAEGEIMSAVRAFARAASAGEVGGRLPCLFLWGLAT